MLKTLTVISIEREVWSDKYSLSPTGLIGVPVPSQARERSCICKTQIDVQSLNPCPFSNSQIDVQFSNLWPFLTFSNRRPMTSALTLTLTNNSAIYLRIWKGRRFEYTLKFDRYLR
jgi:hypothetical protein